MQRITRRLILLRACHVFYALGAIAYIGVSMATRRPYPDWAGAVFLAWNVAGILAIVMTVYWSRRLRAYAKSQDKLA